MSISGCDFSAEVSPTVFPIKQNANLVLVATNFSVMAIDVHIAQPDITVSDSQLASLDETKDITIHLPPRPSPRSFFKSTPNPVRTKIGRITGLVPGSCLAHTGGTGRNGAGFLIGSFQETTHFTIK